MTNLARLSGRKDSEVSADAEDSTVLIFIKTLAHSAGHRADEDLNLRIYLIYSGKHSGKPGGRDGRKSKQAKARIYRQG